MNKSQRNIAITAAVIVVLLVGIVLVCNLDTAPTDTPQTSAESVYTVYSAQADRVEKFEVACDGETLTAQNDNGSWTLNGFLADETDSTKVLGLVNTALSITSRNKIEEKASLSEYGLDEPDVTVTVTDQNGGVQTILIGDKSPVLGEYFVMLDGGEEIYTIYEFMVDTLKQPISYYREFERFNINIDDITDIKIIRKDGTIELKIEGDDIGNVWSMLTPYSGMANDDYIDIKILEPIDSIELKTPVDGKQDAVASDTSTLVITVTPYDNSTGKYGEEYTQTLTVGKTEGDVTYIGYEGSVYAVSKDSFSFMNETAYNIVSKLQAFADIAEVRSVTLEYGDVTHTIGITNNDNVFSFTLDGSEADSKTSQGIYQSIISLAVDGIYGGETTGETVLKITYEGLNTDTGTVVEFKKTDDLNCVVSRNGSSEFTIKKSKLDELLELIEKYTEEQGK